MCVQSVFNYKMKVLSIVKSSVGCRIVQASDEISTDQEAYIEEVLMRFEMENAKPATTVMKTGEKL